MSVGVATPPSMPPSMPQMPPAAPSVAPIDNSQRSGNEILLHIFKAAMAIGASDIQIRSFRHPYVESKKAMICLNEVGELSEENVIDIYKRLIESQQADTSAFSSSGNQSESVEAKIRESFEKMRQNQVDDFSCNGIEMEDGTVSGRLRVQAHLSGSGLGMTCRILNDSIPELEVLGLDEDTITSLRRGVKRRAGLCLVTGPTGSGKSTTLASLIDWLRRNEAKHIVTVEDPIEYRYPHDQDASDGSGKKVPAQSVVTQQEVGRDLQSYRQGLKDVLRKAPHVILVGEIRDQEAMDTCLEAAQTGHLVLSTLHTTGAVKTMGRILEMYPAERQQAILNRLGEMTVFILSQGLLKGTEGKVLTYEFLQNNEDAVGSAIVSYAKGEQALQDAIKRTGNVEWDTKLASLLKKGRITEDTFENTRLNRNSNPV